jgi:hypothetical protein
MNMSRKAYTQLIDQGLIKDERDQHVQLVKPISNRRVRVAGRFNIDGTFVIQAVESSDSPTNESSRRWPIRTIAYLQDGMYCMIGFEHMPGAIEFAT